MNTQAETILEYVIENQRLREVNADLLAALEGTLPLAQTGFSAMSRGEQAKEQQAVLRTARDAIAGAKGD